MDEDKKSVICRVCLAPVNRKCMSLFQKYKNYKIYNHINSIANVKIKEDDGLPNKICPSCLLELEAAISFKLKCESSNIILQTTALNPSTDALEIDVKEVIVKKEEPHDEIQLLEEDSHFFDTGFYDEEDRKPEAVSINELVPKSRAIDLKLQCDDCGDFFKTKCKLRVHWKRIHLPQALICQSCRRTFKTYKAYHRHQTNKRKSCISAINFRIEGLGKARQFYCKECEYKSHRLKDMITHWVIHTGDRPYKCDMCNKACTQQSSLEAHKESVHNKFKVETTCHFCGKLIRGRNRMYRHLKIHTEQGLQCPICQKVLKNKNGLRVHMQRHSGVKSYTCERCANTFYTSAELSNHKRLVHNKGKYWYYCDLCDYKSHRNEAVKKHKAKHNDSNIPCTVCGMFFESTQKLILHQRRHFEEKRHPCPHCEMKFFRRDSVGKHIRAKHRCTMVINQRPGFSVKEESPVVATQYEKVEIDVAPNVS